MFTRNILCIIYVLYYMIYDISYIYTIPYKFLVSNLKLAIIQGWFRIKITKNHSTEEDVRTSCS